MTAEIVDILPRLAEKERRRAEITAFVRAFVPVVPRWQIDALLKIDRLWHHGRGGMPLTIEWSEPQDPNDWISWTPIPPPTDPEPPRAA